MLRFDTIFKKSKTGRKNDVEIEITGFLGAGKTTVALSEKNV
jgi:adenylylsulfate kinase-like enzyme